MRVRTIDIMGKNMADFCRKNKTIICLLCSFCAAYSIANNAKMGDSYVVSNSVFGLLMFIGIYVFLKCTRFRFNRRLLVTTGVLGFVFSSFLVFGGNVYYGIGTYIKQPRTWVDILFLVPTASAVLAALFQYIPLANDKMSGKNAVQIKIGEAEGMAEKADKGFLWCWLLIFAAWLPGFIASYPGVCGYDTVYELNYFNNEFVSIKHTLIHTYLLHFCVVTLGGGIA